MFYQNSNDLVKNASATSGHIQNSSRTREILLKQINVGDVNNDVGLNVNGSRGADATVGERGPSLTLGEKFQHMMQGFIQAVSLKEGIDGAGAGSGPGAPANPSSGTGGNNKDQSQFVNDKVKESNEYSKQTIDHIERVKNIINLINEDNKNSRQKWVEVTDSDNVTKYGYITKDGIFQIWNAPASPITNWLESDKMTQNAAVLGCPAATGSIQKYKIAGTWETIKPFDMVYSHDDNGRKNPLFILVNDALRDPKNSVNEKGIFSCGNERSNVYVSERPSADFHISDPIQRGCYVIADNVEERDIKNRGFIFQEDMTEVSISQCKRRAEDLGSSYFLVSAPKPGKPNNRGGCWIYTGDGKVDTAIEGILTFNNDETKCHTVGNPEDDEDGFMKAYPTTKLKRMYGKNNIETSTDYISKGDGFWASEGPNQYACSGAKGRNTTGNYGDFNRYCIFDKAEDAENWCSSDPTCIGYTNMKNKFFQATKKTPDRNPHGGTYREKSTSSKPSQSVALYSLKRDGPTGVDTRDKNGRGSIGKIAYIDHNGERHEYPESALSFIKPTVANPASYINLGGYDTRSAESSYSLKEITPGNFSEPTNLLYKASRDGWTAQKFHQLCDNKGPTYTRAILTDGRALGAYLSVSWTSNSGYVNDTNAFLYDDTMKYTTQNGAWGAGNYAAYMHESYFPTFGGGHDIYIGGEWMYINAYSFVSGNDRSAPFNRKGWGAYERHNLKDIEVYSVNANRFPKTNPPDYAVRLRTMPIGESITASFEKCRGLCDDDEKCGGFVYTKSGNSTDGKCELKDRAKMYPVGLRIADPTKQLMLKVPTINETITDEFCKVGNGTYNVIDSARYSHYPDTGAMSSGTKCNISDIVPNKGTATMTDLTPIVNAVENVTKDTVAKTGEYRAQTTTSRSESFTGLYEGMTDISGGNYADTMREVQGDLTKIANAEYQRERLLAMTEESNKILISESYKFILWSILAILAVIALLKLKEMFGQDDDDDGGDNGGGFFAYILGLFGIGSVNTDDIPDRTGNVKEALSSAGEQLKEAGEKLTTGITEGADNLVSSANNAMAGAMDGAKQLADKVSETATDAVNKVGDAVGNIGAASSNQGNNTGITGAGTGGRGGRGYIGKKK